MGLLRALAGGLVTGPLSGLEWIARQIADVADQEMSDPARIERALRDLGARLEAGDIDEAAHDAREAELLAELTALTATPAAGEDGRTQP